MLQLALLVWIIILCVLYFLIPYLALPNANIWREGVLRVWIISFSLYFSSIDLKYGFLALVVSLTLYEILHSKQLNNMVLPPSSDKNRDEIIHSLNNNETFSSQMIPPIIIQTGPNKLDDKSFAYMDEMRRNNPDYQYMYFNDDDIDRFFKSNYPEYHNTYKRLPVFIQKIDFFRYLAVYHYGGFYFDTDIKILEPLDDKIRSHSVVFPVDEYIVGQLKDHFRYQPIVNTGLDFLLGQYAFASIPKHPFLKLLIDTIHENIEMYISTATTAKDRELYVYRTTGPDFVTFMYANYAYKNQLYILTNGKRQYFGDYARHDFFGSWK